MASAQSRKPRLRFPGQNRGPLLGSLSSVRFTRKPKRENEVTVAEKKTKDCLPFKVASQILLTHFLFCNSGCVSW